MANMFLPRFVYIKQIRFMIFFCSSKAAKAGYEKLCSTIATNTEQTKIF